MHATTREKILTTTVPLLAINGYSGTSMRDVAMAVGIRPSVIYHYFPDKEALFYEIRARLNEELNSGAEQLPRIANAEKMLRQLLTFRIQHREAVVALRQFFTVVKLSLPSNPRKGYLPAYAYEEMRRIIEQGANEGRFEVHNVAFTAKALTHLIDGFLLEYYPHGLSADDERLLARKIMSVVLKLLRPAASRPPQ